MGHWQELEHTADLALHIWARDLADLFATAARGMVSLIADVQDGAATSRATITLDAPDAESLLVDWLNELLYLSETGAWGCSHIAFKYISPTHLEAEVQGNTITTYLSYVKAATFHNLEIKRTEKGYETEIVFDT